MQLSPQLPHGHPTTARNTAHCHRRHRGQRARHRKPQLPPQSTSVSANGSGCARARATLSTPPFPTKERQRRPRHRRAGAAARRSHDACGLDRPHTLTTHRHPHHQLSAAVAPPPLPLPLLPSCVRVPGTRNAERARACTGRADAAVAARTSTACEYALNKHTDIRPKSVRPSRACWSSTTHGSRTVNVSTASVLARACAHQSQRTRGTLRARARTQQRMHAHAHSTAADPPSAQCAHVHATSSHRVAAGQLCCPPVVSPMSG